MIGLRFRSKSDHTAMSSVMNDVGLLEWLTSEVGILLCSEYIFDSDTGVVPRDGYRRNQTTCAPVYLNEILGRVNSVSDHLVAWVGVSAEITQYIPRALTFLPDQPSRQQPREPV